MSEYLPSFIVEPVLRQARRFSRLSSGEESPGILPAVPDFQRWNPSRFWSSSPPPSFDEENKESTVQSIARSIQLWTSQLNGLDQMPSPPLEALDDVVRDERQTYETEEPSAAAAEFPALDAETTPTSRAVPCGEHGTDGETCTDPAQELPYGPRVDEDDSGGSGRRPLSRSDPNAAGPSTDSSRDASFELHEQVYLRRDSSGALPEDDGMGPLRQRITAVWAGPGTAAEKSKLIHSLMMEKYRDSKNAAGEQRTPSSSTLPRRVGSLASIRTGASQDVVYNLSPADLVPTYAPLDPDAGPQDDLESLGERPRPVLGCIHYKRNVKMQCATCECWYTCRLCHDEVENHTLPRRETKHMLCMWCNTPQPVSQICKMCNTPAACYYCPVCKLWNNDPEKSIYHCDDCGICRLGKGLGKDFFHCQTCAACMSIQAESTHKCIEKSTKCDCPICGEYMFTSNQPVAFMRCGHGIHETCFAEWCNTSYKCPICSKSIANMESQFRRLDRHIEEQPMPEEYRDNRAYIFCNDCNSRSVTRYHWLGLKCTICESYNTTQLELLGPEPSAQLQEQQERAQEAGVGEAGITASQGHTPTGELTSPAQHDPHSRPPTTSPVAARSPTSTSTWLMLHSPSSRSTRSASPVVGSYFGTGQGREAPRRGASPMPDDDDLDFWGGGRDGGGQKAASNAAGADANASESDEASSSDDAMEEDDEAEDDEEDDALDLIGHI